MNEKKKPGKGKLISHIILKHVGRLLLLVLTVLIVGVVAIYLMLQQACHGPSPAAKNLFTTTILETGAFKWTARLLMTEEEINEVLQSNVLESLDVEIDSSLITVAANSGESEQSGEGAEEEFDINGITVERISGRTFEATMMIINDPSRITLQTNAPDWEITDLDDLVEKADAIGGVNGGIYDQNAIKPYYLAVSRGEVVFCESAYKDLYIIGFDEDNILRIIPTGDIHASMVEKLVEENHIRDATVFTESFDPTVSHFVQLVINGVPRETNGFGSGCNPRTAIGQRADGAVLLLVTDGRGANGHLGATAKDLVDIMVEYGAVNAANLDGGGSSAMYFDGEYLMTSTTLYYPNSSYKIPTAFVIEKRD